MGANQARSASRSWQDTRAALFVQTAAWILHVGRSAAARSGSLDPQGRGWLVADLRRRLEEAGEPLFLVVAPPGFGKTNLLADWATTTDAEVAWLGCQPADAEPVRFWSRLVATVSARWPGTASDAAMILRRPSWDDAEPGRLARA